MFTFIKKRVEYDAMHLTALTEENVCEVREWRLACRESLRTPYLQTDGMQKKFFDNVVNDPRSPFRYYAVKDDEKFLGMGGFAPISWENRNGEISLIIDPIYRGEGVGISALKLLLDEAFENLNLNMIFGECYLCSPALPFWDKAIDLYKAKKACLPQRKYWKGQYFDSLYFSFFNPARGGVN